jgi:hypothetical protein
MQRRLCTPASSWVVLRQAHSPHAEAAASAQQWLIERYGGAVHRYLLRVLGDAQRACELTQELSLDLVRGAFRRAMPERGRFRCFIRTALFRLLSRYHHAVDVAEDVLAFRDSWRDQLLARAWQALAREEPGGFVVLRCRADHPAMPPAEMARLITEQLGQPGAPDWVRQTLRRARDRFSDLLLGEVAQSLEPLTSELLTSELAELGLLDYCRSALQRRFPTLS